MTISDRHLNPPVKTFSSDQLAQWCPKVIAEDLSHLFAITDGVQISIDDNHDFDNITLDELSCVLDPENRASLSEVFQSLFVIGSDGGSQVVAYDLSRAPDYPIVMHCPGVHEDGQAIILAANMPDFIQTYINQPTK